MLQRFKMMVKQKFMFQLALQNVEDVLLLELMLKKLQKVSKSVLVLKKWAVFYLILAISEVHLHNYLHKTSTLSESQTIH